MTLVLVFKNRNDVAPATGAKNDEPRTLCYELVTTDMVAVRSFTSG
jgi:hypothetical protein